MPLNHYVTLGRSGLRVSPFCLGAMTFGEDLGWGTSVETSNAIIDRYLALGGNFIDTANVYTHGHSEKIIGDHIGRTPSKRDRVVIATKFFGNLFPGDPNGGGTGAKSLIAATHESLRRLQTDYIDLLWMHLWDRHTPIEETMRTLDDLVRAGKVRYIGFSDTPAWKVAQAQLTAQFRGWTPLVALQIEYSLLERTVEGELIPMAQELGLGVTPWSPLKSGVLSGKYTRENAGTVKPDRGVWVEGNLGERAYSVIDVLVKVAKEVDSTPARVALAWVQSRPGVSSTIIGARTLEQLENNVGALDVKLTPAQVAALDEVSKPALNFPAGILQGAPAFMHGGLTINGVTAPVSPITPKADSKRY
ncbi:aldo/keto reductase [Vitiosangium sp. GDMCC 1.1324]|uniref:aldo/keto reductase n=1 Tax=Vitiosangium sp. (strain GDMCC 1.1324) TaxID=2138576 RepID=UPI000D3BB874|nr:aldo/keto reductase [Vitiosangium sp. GDMCC 1.1324]PTL79737.1 aldo/keto reductase [Vitiosangium sp. GDMCC 1.1324]